jgi:iron complex outermembrane receptor protein
LYTGANPADQWRDTKAYAVFAQEPTTSDNVGLTSACADPGGRGLHPVPAYAGAAVGLKSFTGTSPKVGINWQVLPDLLTYVSWTKGFKSGGFNPVPANANTGTGQQGQPTPYDEETVDSYELGVKYQTEDQRFRVNFAGFIAKYEGLQLPVFFPGTSTSYTSNASNATIEGIELEPTWQATDSLQLYAPRS